MKPRQSPARLAAPVSVILALLGASPLAVCAAEAFGSSGASGLAQAVVPGVPTYPEETRGRALYEEQCDTCHDRSVHAPTHRTARDFGEIREAVDRWQREVGTAWGNDDIDAVARYLNQRYYRFPCPVQYCPRPWASESAPRAGG